MEDRSVINVGNLHMYKEIVGLKFIKQTAGKRRTVGIAERFLTSGKNEAPIHLVTPNLQKKSGNNNR